MPKLSDLLGIGPAQSAKLKKANVDSIEALRERGATPNGRAEIASVSGIKPELLHEWVNRADLLQIKGIGSGYSNLLMKAGIHNIEVLADHKPKELHSSLVTVNLRLGQVARLPSQGVVKTWVRQAKTLATKNSAFDPTGTGDGLPGGGRGKQSPG